MNVFALIKNAVIGRARNLSDQNVFHNMSLIALLAWVGLGADGLSSSCYGPEQAYLALGGHPFLSLFVAAGSVLTILVICVSYSQIIEAFPTGGGSVHSIALSSDGRLLATGGTDGVARLWDSRRVLE